MGHRDRTTSHILPRPYGRRDVAIPVAGHADVRFGSLRRLRQTVGYQGGRLQADLPRSRIGHQRRHVFPQRFRIRHGQRRRHLSTVRRQSGPGIGDVQPRQHHMRHHQRRFQQIRTSAVSRLRRFQLQRLGFDEDGTCG